MKLVVGERYVHAKGQTTRAVRSSGEGKYVWLLGEDSFYGGPIEHAFSPEGKYVGKAPCSWGDVVVQVQK
jgi:hypothetical protein